MDPETVADWIGIAFLALLLIAFAAGLTIFLIRMWRDLIR